MNPIRQILEELARHSHQAKGTDSYYPIVDKALNDIAKIVEGMNYQHLPGSLPNEYLVGKKAGYNQAISEVVNLIRGGGE